MLGVRNAAIVRLQSGGKNLREPMMAVSLRESVQLVSDPQNLDASVEEVFRMMLGVNCLRNAAPPPTSHGQESMTAVVGFGGILSGACVFRCTSDVALTVAGHMTATEFQAVDDLVKDAIGEMCNILAGTWKGKVPELSANCGLSVPAVITGRDYNLHVQAPEFQLQHHYRFGEASFSVTIVCDGLQ